MIVQPQAIWSRSGNKKEPVMDLKTVDITYTDDAMVAEEGGGVTYTFAVRTVKQVAVVGKSGRVSDRYRLLFECDDVPIGDN